MPFDAVSFSRAQNPIPAVYNFCPENLARWIAARGKVVAGVADAQIACLADSTGAGCGAGINDAYDRARRRSFPARLSERLAALGLRSTYQNIWGDSGFTAAQTLAVLGPEVTVGAGWASAASNVLGGDAWQQTAAGGAFEWTPTIPVSHFRWWTTWYGSDRVIAITVDGVEVQRINTKASPVAFVGTEIAAGALGAHTIGLKYISGGGATISGLEAYDKSVSSVRVHNMGHGGGKAAEILQAGTDTQPGYPLNAIQKIAPDLVLVNAGLNDISGGGAAILDGSYAATMQAGITAAQRTSDVILQIPNPCDVARASQDIQDAMANIILSLGARNGCVVIDQRRLFGGSYVAGKALGLYSADWVHPSAAGYVGEAYVIADLLMRA
jgi:lysophospholipase L1-like esterase